MKKILLTFMCFLMLAAAGAMCANAKEPDKTTVKVGFNSYFPGIEGYIIDGKNYYKIKDVWDGINGCLMVNKFAIRKNEQTNKYEVYTAEVFGSIYAEELISTEASFRVYPYKEQTYGKTVWATEDLETGERNAYVTKDPYVYMRDRIFRPNEGSVNITSVTGKEMTLKRYEINGDYFYNIEDICALAGLKLYMTQSGECIFTLVDMGECFSIHTESGDIKSSDYMFENGNYARTIRQYITDVKADTFCTFNISAQKGNLSSYTYRKSDFTAVSHCLIPMELDYFCGFFSGEKYNYIAFGASNSEENPDKEIIRVVKYDKSFNRLASLSLTTSQCYAISIADAATMRMAENGSELVIHTSRTRPKTEDGLNHQSQLSIVIDTDTMTVKNYTGAFQTNHVSHSFNQFVEYDGNDIVYLDLGDAYPRSVVINTPKGKVDILDIPGQIGNNYTGIRLGGFEISDNNYIITYNSDNFEKPHIRERNAYIAVCAKSDNSVKTICLTDFTGKLKWATEPYLVKISDNRYLVMWGEYLYNTTPGIYHYQLIGTKYVMIDGNGNFVSEIRSSSKPLSTDIKPVYMDNAVYWYKDIVCGRLFYKISLDPMQENPIKVTYNGEEIEFDQNPVVENGRTLVPLRAIFEKLGADVDWNSETKTVTATKGDVKISLTIDSTNAVKNGENITLDTAAKVINNRTLVPVRFVAEALGTDVGWDNETRQVLISSK